VHRQILGQGFVAADHVDQHADLGAAVDVAGRGTLGFSANEAADGHVLADLADEGLADLFNGLAVDLEGGQGFDVGRVLGGDEFGNVLDEGQEVVVLGDEVGLAVDFDHRAQLGVGGDVDADDAFGGHAGGSLGGLVAQLDAQDFFGLGHVASGFGQGLLALHHGCVGFLAQLLDHACGDFRHACS